MSRFVSVRSRRLSLWQSAVHSATNQLPIAPATKSLMRQGAATHVSHAAAGQLLPRSAHAPGAPLTANDHARLSKGYFELAEAQRTGNAAKAETALTIIRDYSEYDPAWAACVALYNAYYVAADQQAAYVDWSTQTSPDISTF